MAGYAGRILDVDLSRGVCKSGSLPEGYLTSYIGAEGITARLAHELIPPRCDALSPENVLIFGVGPLVGTIVPGAAKSVLMAKSPLTGLLGRSGTGGRSGMLKFAGFDNLVIRGRAAGPVILRISDGEASLVPAVHLRGQDTFETTNRLRAELGEDYTIAAIGPAGENVARLASVVVDGYSAFARTGIGAVMGSKNLKAIAIKGTGEVRVADRARFIAALRPLWETLKKHPNLDKWRREGTLISLADFARAGHFARYNYRSLADESMFNDFDMEEFFRRIKRSDISCLACPVGCKHNLEINGGEFDGHTVGVSCFNVVIQFFAAQCGVHSWDDAARCVELTNRLGLDIVDTANMIAFATDLFRHGVISASETDGLQLEWGSGQVVHRLIEKMARREGIGDILADGPVRASQHIGRGAEGYLAHIKGMTTPNDLRARLSPEAFSSLIAFRGANPSFTGLTLIPRDPESVKRYGRRIGIPPEAFDSVFTGGPEGYDIVKLTRWSENYWLAMQNLGLCVFPFYQRMGMAAWAELYSALTGRETPVSDLHLASERTWHLEKWFNVRAGATRADDRAPRRFLEETLAVANGDRPPLDEPYLDKLVDEYYRERGWDPVKFRPLDETIRTLALDDVISM